MMRKKTSRHCWIIVIYACTILVPLSGVKLLQSSDKYSKTVVNYSNCRFYFRVDSLRLFPSKDSYNSAEV